MTKTGLRNRINKKLRSSAGESLSETLVSLLISALALAMLAGAITAASHMITSSRDKLRTYYAAKENVETRGATTGSNLNVTIKENKTNGATIQSNISVGQYSVTAFRKNIVAYKKIS